MRAVHVSSQLVVLKGSASALIATVECKFRPRKHLTMLACLLPSCDRGRGSAASRASRTIGLRSRGVGAPPLAACEGHLLTERQAAFCGSLLGCRLGRTLIGLDPAVATAYRLAWRRARFEDGSTIHWGYSLTRQSSEQCSCFACEGIYSALLPRSPAGGVSRRTRHMRLFSDPAPQFAIFAAAAVSFSSSLSCCLALPRCVVLFTLRVITLHFRI